jgi:hypothetical protein
MKTSTKLFALSLLAGSMAALALESGALPARGPIPFSALDTDGNGVITQQEFNQVHAQRLQTRTEQGWPMRNCNHSPDFASFDQNRDGLLNENELASGRQARRQDGGCNSRMGRGRYGGPGSGMRQGRHRPGFAEFDLNRDGAMVEEEFDQARARRIAERAQAGRMMRNLPNAPSFSDLDKDGDGRVSPDEFTTAQMLHRQQRFQ